MLQSEQIKQVIFDLGAVLLEWQPDKILAEFCCSAHEKQNMKNNIILHPDWLELDKGCLTEAQAVQDFARRTGIARNRVQDFFQHVRASLTLKEDTFAIMDSFYKQKFDLYCLSNMPIKNYEFLKDKYDFFQLFEGIVVSGYLKMIKPDVAIFNHTLELFNLSAEETLFIDDSRANILAAEGLGIHSLQFTCSSRDSILQLPTLKTNALRLLATSSV